jgi:hypothetical protein
MIVSFVERIGRAHGFSSESVAAVFVVLRVINLLSGGPSALLQHRLSPIAVGFAGPVVQVLLAFIIVQATSVLPYAIAVAPYVFVVIVPLRPFVQDRYLRACCCVSTPNFDRYRRPTMTSANC